MSLRAASVGRARKNKTKNDVGAQTRGVVEDSSGPRLLPYEAFRLAAFGVADWYGAAWTVVLHG